MAGNGSLGSRPPIGAESTYRPVTLGDWVARESGSSARSGAPNLSFSRPSLIAANTKPRMPATAGIETATPIENNARSLTWISDHEKCDCAEGED